MYKVALTALVQLAALGGIFYQAASPVLSGKVIEVETRGIDPRNIFRGHYVVLNYSMSAYSGGTDNYQNQKYIYLSADSSGLYNTIHLEDGPERVKILITGINGHLHKAPSPTSLDDNRTSSADSVRFNGRHEFYMPREDAQKWEKALASNTAIARIAVDDAGITRIVGVRNATMRYPDK
jgi:hypothetical protein